MAGWPLMVVAAPLDAGPVIGPRVPKKLSVLNRAPPHISLAVVATQRLLSSSAAAAPPKWRHIVELRMYALLPSATKSNDARFSPAMGPVTVPLPRSGPSTTLTV